MCFGVRKQGKNFTMVNSTLLESEGNNKILLLAEVNSYSMYGRKTSFINTEAIVNHDYVNCCCSHVF